MIAKIWKKVLIIIVAIACLFNVVAKLATKISFSKEMELVTDYVKTVETTDNSNTIKNAQK